LSSWQEKLLEFYDNNSKFILPISRRNEVVNFVKSGLNDLSVSRTSFTWGIKVPNNDKHVIYVWLDALTNYLSALNFPDTNDRLYKRFWPASLHVIGKDILRFHAVYWPAFLLAAKIKPPSRVFGHGWILSGEEKMSKSKGNIIDPLELIEKYSADALRFTLLSMASPGRDVKLSEDRVKGYRNFLNKLWNANNFLKVNKCDFDKTSKTPKISININKWIYGELIETKNIVEKNIKDYRFDEAARNIYQFVWHSYCDWYVELSKTILYSKDQKAIKEVREVSSYIFKQILILIHPFIPFVTEEIWLKNKLDNSKKNFLMLANWPKGKAKKDKNFKEVKKLINMISEIRSFKNELNLSPGSFIDISIEKVKNKSFFKENDIILKRLGRINNFYNKNINKPAATFVISGDLFKIYFDQTVDLNLIKENLVKRQNKCEEELNKVSQRLDNKSFVDRAPKNIVDQEKTNYSDLKNDIQKITLTIESL